MTTQEAVNEIQNRIDAAREKTASEMEELRSEVKEVKASGGRFGGGNFSHPKTLEENIIDWVQKDGNNIKALQPGTPYTYSMATERKAAGTMTAAANLTGAVFQSGINQVPMRSISRFHLSYLLRYVQTATGSVTYPQSIAVLGEGSFGRTTPGSLKPQIDYDLIQVTTNLSYIAGVVDVAREILTDLAYLGDYIQRNLLEDFRRSEDAYYLPTLITAATTGATSATVTVEKVIDYVAQIVQNGYTATAILTSPAVWAAILKTKGTTSDYSIPGGVQFSPDGYITIAGLPLIPFNAMPAGKVLIGDFQNGAAIAVVEQFNIRTSDTAGENFKRNLITFRGEAREDLMLFAPQAFVYGNS